MGLINVPGLGIVEIAGDTPTEAEDREMLQLLSGRETAPPAQQRFTPEQIESAGLGGLAETMRGFQELEAPAGREFWGDYEHPLQKHFVRPLAAGVSAVQRGPLETGLAVAEATVGPEALPGLRQAHQSWRDWERGLEAGAKPEDEDIYVVAEKATAGDVGPLVSLIQRGIVKATPGMAAALVSMPGYMGSLVGGYAKESAANRGSDTVGLNDLGRGVAVAAAVSAAERGSALATLGGGGASTVGRAALRGAAIEGAEEAAQGAIETLGTQFGTREGPDLWHGVDLEEGLKRSAHGLAVGAGMGGFVGGTAAVARRDPLGALGRRIADDPAQREATLRETVQSLEDDAAQQAAEPTPVTEEVVAEVEAPAFDPEASLEEYRLALDGRDPNPAEDIRTIEAILQRPGAGPWLGNMQNMALGRLEGDPFSERLRYGARRAEELWEQRRAAPAEEVVTEEVVTPTQARRIATGFSGTGTVEAALTGVRSVHAVEHDPKVVEQYNKAHGTSYKPRSIVDVDPAEIAAESPDVYHASPVCKNFSKAKRLRTADKGDVASAEAVSRVIREAEPPVVTVENVPAYKDTALFRLITDALDAKGYTWDVVEHDAADYGAPQSRKRILLRAVREGSLPPLPPKTAPGDWYAAVEDLIAAAPESTIPQWERDRIARMVKRGTLDVTKPILTMGGSAGSGVAAAVNAGSPSKTLKATPKEVPRILMPDGTVKRVTPRMMARLMGLPDTFAIPDHHGLAKTVLGNGISGEVTRSLIQPLVDRATPTEEVAETVLTVVPGAEPGAKRTLAPQDAPPIDAVDAIIEEGVEPRPGTAPATWEQDLFGVAMAGPQPPPIPRDALDAVDVQMEKDRLADQVSAAARAAKEAAEGVAPRPSGAKPKAAGGKATTRKRSEAVKTPTEPMSAKDAIRRLALVANETGATEADVTDAVNEAAAAELRESGQAIAPRNADNIEQIKQLAREMGRTDEEIDQLLSHQKMGFADVITAMDGAGLRATLSESGRAVELPAATRKLIDEVNQGRLSPSNVEIAAIHSTYRAAIAARENVLKAVEGATDTAEVATLATEDATLRSLALDALLAQKAGGTPAAQALRFRQYLIDPLMNVVEAQARATLKKRKPLTEEEVARLNKLWDTAERAEAQAVEAEAKAQAALKRAARRLKSAEKALRASEEVKKEAKKKTRKPKKKGEKKKTARQEAAEQEARPVRVTPIKKSADQRALERALKAAQKQARKAADGVQKAKAKSRKAQRDKGAVPEATVNKWLARYRTAFGAALVLNASGDDSALGRQALGLAIQMPSTALKTIPMAVRAAPWTPGHRAYALKMQEEMLASPNQALRDYADLEMTDVEGRSNIDVEVDPYRAQEEAWMFRAFETGFIADVLVQPSQNIFGLTLNKLRTEAFDEGARLIAEIHGTDLETMRKADLRMAPDGSTERQFANDIKALGLLVNVSTGRGTFNARALGVARHLMFAPRYTMSRFELPWRAVELAAGKGQFSDVSPAARALFMKRAARQMSWAMGMMVMSGIAAAANGDDAVEAVDNFFNPEHPDYLKMRIGDYHVDTMQGLGATWRYVWPFVFSPASTLEDFLKEGKLPDAHVPWRKEHIAPLEQLSRNKLAPLVSWLVKVGRGSDWRGRDLEKIPASERGSYRVGLDPTNISEATMAYALDRVVFPSLGLVTPIGLQQAADAFGRHATDDQKDAFQKGIPLVLNFFGISAAHYKPRSEEKRVPGMPRAPRAPRIPRAPITRWD